jgi:putative phage-type endonuclease
VSAKLLMTQDEITENRGEWEKVRSTTIGASEIAVLLGLAPKSHGNPFSLWVEKKTGEATSDGEQDEERRGLVLEPYVAAELAKMRPDLAVLPGGLYHADGCPWMTATFDRFTVSREAAGTRMPLFGTSLAEDGTNLALRDELRGLMVPAEIKTSIANDFAEDPYRWGEPYTDQVPVNYKAQAYWQMSIWGCDRILMPVQFMQPWKTVLYVINRTDDAEEDIAFMVREAGKFLDRLDSNTPPPVDWTPASAQALLTLNPLQEGAVYRATKRDATRFRASYLRFKAAERRYNQLRNELAAKAGGAQHVVVPDPVKRDRDGQPKDVNVLTRSAYDMTTIDDGRLRTEEPEVARRFERVTRVDSWRPGQRWMKLPAATKGNGEVDDRD